MTAEPQLKSEETFQAASLAALRERLDGELATAFHYAIIEPFGLDAAVIVRSGTKTGLRLIEFKAFAGQRPSGVGFGNRRGEGPQVDLLALPDALLAVVDPWVRWCFADLSQPRGEARYSVITSVEARTCAMGGVRPGKQNNFSIRQALARPLTWDAFLDELHRFVRSESVDGPGKDFNAPKHPRSP